LRASPEIVRSHSRHRSGFSPMTRSSRFGARANKMCGAFVLADDDEWRTSPFRSAGLGARSDAQLHCGPWHGPERRVVRRCSTAAHALDGQAWRAVPGVPDAFFWDFVFAAAPNDLWLHGPSPASVAQSSIRVAHWDGSAWQSWDFVSHSAQGDAPILGERPARRVARPPRAGHGPLGRRAMDDVPDARHLHGLQHSRSGGGGRPRTSGQTDVR